MATIKFPIFVKSYDECLVRIDFTCKCGSHEVMHTDSLSISYFEGKFMCTKCGMTVVDGKELNYYHPRFKISRIKESIQLEIF